MKLFPQLAVFGEALTDFIRQDDGLWKAVAGGSPWNIARVASRLGVLTGFGGAISKDVFGTEIWTLSKEAGLDDRFLQQVEKLPLLAMVPSKNPPQYFFIGNDSADLAFEPNTLPYGWLEAVQIVHFGSLGLARQPLAERLIALARRAHDAGKTIAFDPNYRSPMAAPEYRETLRQLTSIADYIKLSEEDIQGLFPETGRDAAVSQLRAWAPDAAILITDGAAGMTLLTPQGSYFQPAFPVTVVDTVGCGDASMGGWLTSLLTRPQQPAEEHLRYAAACAAVCCGHAGAYAPTADEVNQLLIVK
jgi:fructokinase